MAELLAGAGAAASVIQLADYAVRISRGVFKFLADVKDAPKEINRLQHAIDDLNQVLHNVRVFCSEFQMSKAATVEHEELPEFIKSLKGCISELELLEKETLRSRTSDADRRVRNVEKSFGWAIRKKGLLESQRRLQEHKASLQIALTTICVRTNIKIRNDVDVVRQEISGLMAHTSEHYEELTQASRAFQDTIKQQPELYIRAVQDLSHEFMTVKQDIDKAMRTNSHPAQAEHSLRSTSYVSRWWDRSGFSIFTEHDLSSAVCYSPIGVLYYRRSRKKVASAHSGPRRRENQDESLSISFKFIPPRWLHIRVIEMTIELFNMQNRTWNLSIGLKAPGRVCWDEAVLKSLGLRIDRYDRNLGYLTPSTYVRRWRLCDPQTLRNHLFEGRLGPNDFLVHEEMGMVSILQFFTSLGSPQAGNLDLLTICKILLEHGADVETSDSEIGSPLYIASNSCSQINEYPLVESISSTLQYLGDDIRCFRQDSVMSVQKMLLDHKATFHVVPAYGAHRKIWSENHGWIPRLLSISKDPEYLHQVLFKNIDEFDVEAFCPSDQWLISILCHSYPRLRSALESQVSLTSTKGFPPRLELLTVLEEVKNASVVDRRILIGSICRLGTGSMLRPFLQGGFNLNERTGKHIPGVMNGVWDRGSDAENYDRRDESYFLQAANVGNLDTMHALVEAGVKNTEARGLYRYFHDGRRLRCAKHDTPRFVELVLDAFIHDKNHDKNHDSNRLLLSQFLTRTDSISSLAFDDIRTAVICIIDGLIQRGCFLGSPVADSDRSLVPETFEAIKSHGLFAGAREKVSQYRMSIVHMISKYDVNIESTEILNNLFGKDLITRVTFLGMSVERLDLELIALFLELGANIETPIPDGLSALEVAKLNYKFGQEGRSCNGVTEDDKRKAQGWMKDRWTEDGLEDKVLHMLILALRDRGLSAVADKATLETPEYIPPEYRPPVKPEEKPALEQFEWERTILEDFYEDVARWKSSFPLITAVSIDGLLIRFGLIFSLCFAITYECWLGVLEFTQKGNISYSLKTFVVVFLLGLVFAMYLGG